MNVSSRIFVTGALMLAAARADSLADVLARMDRAASEFQSFAANMREADYTAVLDDTDMRTGVVRLKRVKSAIIAVMEFPEPNPETIFLSGRTVKMYKPKANTVEIYDAGKHAAALEELVLLGFGTPTAELRKNYDLKLAGADTVGGVHASRLELRPKSQELKNLVTVIELWVPDNQGYPVQEKITEPSKNYKLVTYSNMRSPAPPDSTFELKLPPGVREIHP